MSPSTRVPYDPSHGSLTTRKYTTYYQTQVPRSRLKTTTQQEHPGMAEEKELAKALALLALPNR